jgi:RNA polymerase sigma-70 factor, ECF subfamily
MSLPEALPALGPPEGDDELVARARRGEPAAQEALFLRHRRGAYLLALQLLGNAEDAHDATQDAMIRFLASLPRFQPGSPVRPWLFSIVRNRCRDLLRRRRVRRTESLEGGDQAWRPELVDLTQDPHRDAEHGQLRRRLWRALAQLPADHREILVLREYHDLSYGEIAAVLGVPQGTVMSRLHRARRQLAAQLSPTLDGGPTEERS